MSKFIINENFSDSIEVEAEKYGFGDGFVNFTSDGSRVFSISSERTITIRKVED